MKKLVVVFLFLCVSLTFLTLFVGVSKVQERPILLAPTPHLYNDPHTSIKNIHLTVFYFVPKDTLSSKRDDWEAVTEPHLKKLSEFHTVQFSGKSTIDYAFFPEIIVGDKASKEYLSASNNDDPDALLPIKDEIVRRVFTKNGDLSHLLKNTDTPDTRNVYLIVFEGDGGSGNGNFCLISRAYLTDKAYETTGTTFLAHEFYHTLLLPDNYDKSMIVFNDNQKATVSLLTKKDIMGQVFIPLPYTYIDKETLKHMGL